MVTNRQILQHGIPNQQHCSQFGLLQLLQDLVVLFHISVQLLSCIIYRNVSLFVLFMTNLVLMDLHGIMVCGAVLYKFQQHHIPCKFIKTRPVMNDTLIRTHSYTLYNAITRLNYDLVLLFSDLQLSQLPFKALAAICCQLF